MTNLQQQSSFEGGIGNWITGGPGNLTVIEGAPSVPHGTKVALLTATGAGTPSFKADASIKIPCSPGEYITAYAEYRWSVGAVIRQCRLNVHFQDATGAAVAGGINAGTLFTPSDSAWTRVQNNDNLAPAGTTQAEIRVVMEAAVLNDAVMVDAIMAVGGANIPNEGPHPPYEVHPSEADILTSASIADGIAALWAPSAPPKSSITQAEKHAWGSILGLTTDQLVKMSWADMLRHFADAAGAPYNDPKESIMDRWVRIYRAQPQVTSVSKARDSYNTLKYDYLGGI